MNPVPKGTPMLMIAKHTQKQVILMKINARNRLLSERQKKPSVLSFKKLRSVVVLRT